MSGTDSAYTRQVKQLIAAIGNHQPKVLTLMHDARQYFASTEDNLTKLDFLQRSNGGDTEDNEEAVPNKQLKNFQRDLDNSRHERLSRFNDVATTLMSLTEGHTLEETLEHSAKALGTLLLLTEGNRGKFAKWHQTLKPFYKSILSLRLCDAILAGGSIKHHYLSKYIESNTRFTGNRHWQQKWLTGIARPLIKASIFQDIGLQHPKAQAILIGENGKKNPFRLLEETERQKLLKLNYHYTLDYIQNGLGLPGYTGNTKEERDAFLAEEEAALDFCKDVITDATKAKNNIGELVKIPQVYASFVLSTKSDYSRVSLPKGYMVIDQLAKKGTLNKRMSEEFLSLVGHFPQGFGICYLPLDDQGMVKDHYEYAIVNRLNPKTPSEPYCRVATRNLAYIRGGKDIIVSKGENLYFQNNHKKILQTNLERLREILSQLHGDYHPDNAEELIPKCWEPFDYFTEKQHQNLWTKL